MARFCPWKLFYSCNDALIDLARRLWAPAKAHNLCQHHIPQWIRHHTYHANCGPKHDALWYCHLNKRCAIFFLHSRREPHCLPRLSNAEQHWRCRLGSGWSAGWRFVASRSPYLPIPCLTLLPEEALQWPKALTHSLSCCTCRCSRCFSAGLRVAAAFRHKSGQPLRGSCIQPPAKRHLLAAAVYLPGEVVIFTGLWRSECILDSFCNCLYRGLLVTLDDHAWISKKLHITT